MSSVRPQYKHMSSTIWYNNTHITFEKTDTVLGWEAQNYINPEEDVLKPPSMIGHQTQQEHSWKTLEKPDLRALQYDLETITTNRAGLATTNIVAAYLPDITRRWAEKGVPAEQLSALVAGLHPHWLDNLVQSGVKTNNTYRALNLEEIQSLTSFTIRTNPKAWLASASVELDKLTEQALGENRQNYVDKHPYHTYIGCRKRSGQGTRPGQLDVELYTTLLIAAQNLPYRPDLVNKQTHQTLLAALIAKPALWPDWKAEGSFEKQVGNILVEAVAQRNPRNPVGRTKTAINELQNLSDQAAVVAYRRSGGSIQPVFFTEQVQNLTEQLQQLEVDSPKTVTATTPSTTLPKKQAEPTAKTMR